MKPTKQTVYLPIRVEDELPTHEVCALNDNNMLVGHLKHLGKGVIRPIVYAEDEHQEMGNITHWLKPQEGYFFTPEQLNEYFNKAKKLEIDEINDLFKKIDIEIIKIKYSYPQIWQGSTALTELTIKLEELKTQYLIFK